MNEDSVVKWECIDKSGYIAIYLVNDEGKSMSAAQKAIEYEDDRFKRLQTAQSDAVKEKKTKEYEKAKKEAEEKIEIYDHFHYLYLCLISTLQVFDKHGNLNEREAAETTVWAALDLMSELNNPKVWTFSKSINKEVKTIGQLIPDLFSYLDEAKRIVEQLKDLQMPAESPDLWEELD